MFCRLQCKLSELVQGLHELFHAALSGHYRSSLFKKGRCSVWAQESGKALCFIQICGRESSIAFIVWYGDTCL